MAFGNKLKGTGGAGKGLGAPPSAEETPDELGPDTPAPQLQPASPPVTAPAVAAAPAPAEQPAAAAPQAQAVAAPSRPAAPPLRPSTPPRTQSRTAATPKAAAKDEGEPYRFLLKIADPELEAHIKHAVAKLEARTIQDWIIGACEDRMRRDKR